jgi:hypothetical protein
MPLERVPGPVLPFPLTYERHRVSLRARDNAHVDFNFRGNSRTLPFFLITRSLVSIIIDANIMQGPGCTAKQKKKKQKKKTRSDAYGKAESSRYTFYY